MSKRKNKRRKPINPTQSSRTIWNNFWKVITAISVLFGIGMGVYTLAVQQPINNEFSNLKHDFPMVQDYSEAKAIARQITVPEPLGTYRNLDYFVIVAIKETVDTPTPFRDADYGYVLQLKTNIHSYVAIDSSDNSTQKKIIFTISELRSGRKNMAWIIYEGPLPPPGWLNFK